MSADKRTEVWNAAGGSHVGTGPETHRPILTANGISRAARSAGNVMRTPPAARANASSLPEAISTIFDPAGTGQANVTSPAGRLTIA